MQLFGDRGKSQNLTFKPADEIENPSFIFIYSLKSP